MTFDGLNGQRYKEWLFPGLNDRQVLVDKLRFSYSAAVRAKPVFTLRCIQPAVCGNNSILTVIGIPIGFLTIMRAFFPRYISQLCHRLLVNQLASCPALYRLLIANIAPLPIEIHHARRIGCLGLY